MADLRIVDAPEIPTNNITGQEKLPTGGSGNYSISLDSIANYTKTKKDLADNTSVDGKVSGVRQELNTHIEDLLNPHQVTKGQIGLGNVDNTADADKPVSNSAQAAIISAVAPKADKTYVDNQLTLKANKTDVYTKQESGDLVNNSISTALTPINTSLDLAKRGVINRYDSSLTYNSGERVVLANGDIVKSTVDGNTNDPNVDMTGWVSTNNSNQIFYENQLTKSIRLASDKFSDFQTLQDYGAIGDGTSKTLQHWIDTGEFSSLSAIQIVYPNATALTETIDAVCLQDMIDKSYGKRIYLKTRHYNINKPIVIRQGISIIADMRTTAPYGYTETTGKLDFSGLSENAWAITISGFSDTVGQTRITGVQLEGFLLTGVQTVNGLKVGQDISHDVTELYVKEFAVYNFKDALSTTYLYGATFSAFRAQSCVNGLLLGSQTNQVHFDRCAAVTISGKALTLTNCEGVQFSSPNISNLSKADGAPITLYQSQLIVTNGYFENITNPILVQVGTRTENATIASTLILDASLKLGDSGTLHDIQVTNENAYVELRGRARFGARVVGVDDSTPHISSFVQGDNLKMNVGTFVENFPVGKHKTYVQYGGGVLSQTLNRGFIRITNTGVEGSGLRLSEKLVTNELYTLSYAVKKTSVDQAISLRNGAKSPVNFIADESSSSDVFIRHCTFIANDQNLRLLFTGSIDIYAYTIQRGNRRTTDLSRFFITDSATRFTAEALSVPTGSGWVGGDFVFNTVFNATHIGWLYNGTSWLESGMIGAKKAVSLTSSSTAADIVAALKTAGLAT